jgi:beta-lactamase regulating signal transducer with metallopeptidase domain
MLIHHLVGDAIRVALFLGLALTAVALLRGTSSATRRLVLATSLAGALLLPVVSAAVPSWRVETPLPVARFGSVVAVDSVVPAVEGAALAPAVLPPATHAEPARALDWAALAVGVWGAGVALVVARLLAGLVRTRRLVRRATRATAWSRAVARAERTTGQRAEVRETSELDAPAVAGIVAPVILVPRSSSSWTDERRYAVLLHELAHVRQRDCLAHVVARIVCALHWYSPLAWLAAHRLRIERELAADDAVVAAGARASSYAEDLLALACSAGDAPTGALGMVERSPLAARVTAIVSVGRPRRPPTLAIAVLLVASVGAGVLAVACATPEAVSPSHAEPASRATLAQASVLATSTVDPRLESIAEEELGRAMEESKAAAGTVLVLDPSTGEILANAGRAHGAPADVALGTAYVTGSTLKAVLLAGALEESVVSEAERFDCEGGSWTYHGQTIQDSAPHGLLTVPDMLAVSSNVGFTKVYDRLGGERLGHWLRVFHFGTAPAIDRAASGWLPEHIADRSAAGAMLAIGERMTASPLQVAAAYGALANGGVYVPPTLVRRAGEAPREPILRPETARSIVTMLEGVVSREDATGTRARVAGQRVAGKTGTAAWVLPDGSERYYASFVGFVPSTSPRYVILVGLEEPEGERAGGLVAAPVFSRVATRALALGR